MILIWQFGNQVKIAKSYAIIYPFILQAWVSLHKVLKTINLKSRQQYFLSKPPNIMFANNSAFMVYYSAHIYPLYSKVLMLKPSVGDITDISSPLNFFSIVVFPALSKPLPALIVQKSN